MTEDAQAESTRADTGDWAVTVAAWGAALTLIVAIAGAATFGVRDIGRSGGAAASDLAARVQEAFPPDLFEISIDLPRAEDQSTTPGVWYPIHGEVAPTGIEDTGADPDPDSSLERNPSWARPPQPEFPTAAQRAGVEAGVVVLTCRVRADGLISACRVETDDPVNAGFGRATLRAMMDARLSPRVVDGQPLGGQVRFTSRYRLQ